MGDKISNLPNVLFPERSAQYAAAKTTRLTGDWTTTSASPVDIISNSLPTVRDRIRQLVRDFPYMARAVRAATDYVVGTGIKFQSRIKKADGSLNQAQIQKIESAFKRWSDTADYTGKLDFYALQRLAKRQDVECGEFLLIKHYEGPYIPLSYQIVEPDWLTENSTTPFAIGTEIKDGVEYDKNTGRVYGYHFSDPWGWGKAWRAPAENVIHKFEMTRPGMIRGISKLAPGVILADSTRTLLNATLDREKQAAKWLAFVTSDDMGAMQGGVTVNSDGDPIDELETGIIEYLRSGEDVKFSAPNTPSNTFEPFMKSILRMFAVTGNLPHEILSEDYSGLNYSVLRGKRNDFQKMLMPEIQRHISDFCRPIAKDFYQMAALSGVLNLPKYFNDPLFYEENTVWMHDGMLPVDPLKEIKADIDAIDKNLKSPLEVIAARGRDPEDVYREIALAKSIKESLGLTDTDVSTAAQNNPAALDEQDQGEEDD